jgi:hypothetical protein
MTYCLSTLPDAEMRPANNSDDMATRRHEGSGASWGRSC